MRLGSTAHVILGMLEEGPKSGYEIKALVDSSTRFFWAASYGQIYPELRRLSAAGLIEGSEASRGARRRTLYRLTEAGREELLRWLREPPRTFELREEGFLKLFFSGALDPQEAAATLEAMREYRLALLARLREIEPRAAERGGFPLIVLGAGIELNEWFAEWCERTQRALRPAAAKGGR